MHENYKNIINYQKSLGPVNLHYFLRIFYIYSLFFFNVKLHNYVSTIEKSSKI